MSNILAFTILDKRGFFFFFFFIIMFGVSNAKYLAFDTPNENALSL